MTDILKFLSFDFTRSQCMVFFFTQGLLEYQSFQGCSAGEASPADTPRRYRGFSLRVIRRKGWGKKGKCQKVTGQRRCGRVKGTWEDSDIMTGKEFAISSKKEIVKVFMLN